MILRYTRTDGRRTPAAFEQVELGDDGRMLGWRSVSTPAAGSFAGEASADELATATRLAAAAADLPEPTGLPGPESPTELVEIGDRMAVSVSGVDESDDPAWHELTELSRQLVERVVEMPYAAVSLEIDDGVRLVHRGSAPLELDLSGLEVAERVTAGPGWSHELAMATDGVGPVSVTFGIVQGDRTLEVEVTAQPGNQRS